MRNRRADCQPHLRTVLGTGAAFLILAAGGCTALRPVKQPADYIESIQPKLVRVTKNDGSKFLMTGAHIENDTLMGFIQVKGEAVGTFDELPWTEVSKVEAQQWAGDRTLAAIAGGIIVWGGFTYLLIRHVNQGGI
jgi:hypothetical protein